MTYGSLRERFRWNLPARFNMGVATSDEHPADAPALRAVCRDGRVRTTSFGDLARASNRLANALAGLGVTRGDRVAVVLPQSLETALTHIAAWKAGAVSLPLASLFGPDALAYRLGDSGARAVVTTPANLPKVVEALDQLGARLPLVVTGDPAAVRAPHHAFEHLVASASEVLDPVAVDAEDPAYLIYTSGTTGPPKGALHAHRSLFGHLPGFELYYEFFPQPGDVIWTPADWAWIGGLMDVLIPAWYHGQPVVTAEGDFEPARAVELMASRAVTCAFLPPTALKLMRAADVRPQRLALRAVFSGGESLGEEMLAWARERLGVTVNEGYGQTEANLVVGNCASVFPVRPGSMGRAIPGHDVRVLDPDGRPVIGERGEIAVRAPDPVIMLRYWNRPDATQDKYRGEWLLTGDLGVEDEDGYLWFVSRSDDVIISRGYRIGPGEIEESLMGHPAVAMAAVVGVPDATYGQAVKAFVVLRAGWEPDDDLAAELRHHVRTRLAAHEVPRTISFIDDLPRTTTGKVMRRALRDP